MAQVVDDSGNKRVASKSVSTSTTTNSSAIQAAKKASGNTGSTGSTTKTNTTSPIIPTSTSSNSNTSATKVSGTNTTGGSTKTTGSGSSTSRSSGSSSSSTGSIIQAANSANNKAALKEQQIEDRTATTTTVASNPKTQTTTKTVTVDFAQYAPTSDAATNSRLWNEVQNNPNISAADKITLQNALHDRNIQLNTGQVYNKSTGTWSAAPASESGADKGGTGGTGGAGGSAGGANPQNNVAASKVNVADYWDASVYGEYKGGSNDFTTVMNQLYEAGDILGAARIQDARNQYLEALNSAGDSTYYNTKSTNIIDQVRQDETEYVYKLSYSNNGTTYTVSTNTFVDYYGNTRESAIVHDSSTNENYYLADGDSFYGYTYEDSNGNIHDVYYTWSTDVDRDDAGSWSVTEDVTETEQEQDSSYSGDFWSSQYYDYLNEQLETGEQAAIDANKAATEKSVLEIEAQLENGLADYETAASEAYLQMVQNLDALALQNAAAGNTGGIASKQYTASQSAYDAQLLTIALEREYFINTCNQTIAQLEAEGRYNEAQIISDWAQEKIEVINNAYQWYEELAFQKEQFEYEKETTDRNYYYQRALSLLEQGILTKDAVEALGVSATDAQNYVNRLNILADLNIDQAKAELEEIVNSNNRTTTTTPTEEEPVVDTGEMTTTEYTNFMTLLANDQLPIYNASGELVGYTGVNGLGQYTVNMQDGYYTVVSNGGRKFYYDSASQGFTTTNVAQQKEEAAAEQAKTENTAALGREYESLTGKRYVNPTNSLAYLESMQRNLTNQVKQAAKNLGNVDHEVMYQYNSEYRTLYDQLVKYNNLIAKFNSL